MSAPLARREAVVDVLHGVEVPDPYRWLEDGGSPECQSWVTGQNAHTRSLIDGRPERSAWHLRLVELLSAGMSTSVRLAGPHLFCLERSGGAPQFQLVVRSASDPLAAPSVLVDPASLTADGTAAIDWFEPSADGALVAYGVSEGGSERSVLRVIDVDNATVLADEIADTRAASVAWLPDASGFFYTRYPPDSEYDRRVFFHVLGADATADDLVFGDLPDETAWPMVTISPDGGHLLVHVSLGWSRVDVHLLDRRKNEFRTVIKDVEALTMMAFAPSGLIGVTNLDAEKGRVVSAALEHPDAWTTIVAEGDDVIEAVNVGHEGMFVTTLRSAVHGLEYRSFDGSLVSEIELADRISFHGLDADRDTERVFFQAEGFTRPAALYRWTPEHGVEPWGNLPLAADPDSFVVEQVLYPSLDGTAIPMFLVRSARTTATADTPCILTGYGGFNIAMSPAYGPGIVAWCERGGLYAIAGLRGGNEEGESWHRAGMRENKQNVFDDFDGAADWLVEQKLTSRDKLALRGGSNGGLLMGVAITQRPDLARAVHCAVPLLDMVRFHRFLIARLWIAEYGDPDVADEFAWLYAYSPYHHLEPVCYPATLITTAEEDSRVDPSHARKMAAALQHASTCQAEHPILLRIEERAGHGQGKPVHKQADELADVLTFLAWQLGGPEA